MKKLLICALLASFACAEESESIRDNILDVLGQFGEAAMAPVNLVKDAANTLINTEAGQHAKDVATQLFVDFPTQAATGVKDATVKAYQVTAAAVKKAGQKVQDATATAVDAITDAAEVVAITTQDAAEKTVDAFKKVGAEIRETANDMGNMVKESAVALANSEVGENVQDVAGQFAAVPGQVAEDVKDICKAVKRKVSAGFKAACEA
jgi:gas vesicle protein